LAISFRIAQTRFTPMDSRSSSISSGADAPAAGSPGAAPSSLRDLLRAIVGHYRRRLALTYGMTGLENVAELLYPTAIGLAIDGLLNGNPGRVVPLIALWFGHLVVGLVRHVYDTRLFTRIYADMVGDMIGRQRAQNENDNHVAARVALSREMVSFFETEIPAIATGLIRLVGAILMLTYYDTTIGLLALALMVPVAWVNARFAALSYRLNGALNDRLEREIAIVVGAPLRQVFRHFGKVRFWRVRISDAEARTWGLIELIMMVLTLGALLRLAGVDGATTGTIYAVLAYVWSLYDAINDMPAIVQNVARVHDIGERVARG
jgi:ABC-type multidrug transport system fused ATPase/permease subunit